MNASIRAALIVALLVCAEASSEAQTVGEMLSYCRPIAVAKVIDAERIAFSSTPQTGECWGAFGVLQEISVWIESNGQRVLRACVPKDTTRLQLVAIFVKHAEANPKLWHETFAQEAVIALRQAFPCSNH